MMLPIEAPNCHALLCLDSPNPTCYRMHTLVFYIYLYIRFVNPWCKISQDKLVLTQNSGLWLGLLQWLERFVIDLGTQGHVRKHINVGFST